MIVQHIRNRHCGADYTTVTDDTGREFTVSPARLLWATGLSCSCGGYEDGSSERRTRCAHLDAYLNHAGPITYRDE